MSSLEERTQYMADLMAGRTPEALPLEQPALVEQQSAAAVVRPAGEFTSPGFDALPDNVRGPLAAAIGKALAEQQLQFAAQGVLTAPGDVARYLRPEDYAEPDGSVDVAAVRSAVA